MIAELVRWNNWDMTSSSVSVFSLVARPLLPEAAVRATAAEALCMAYPSTSKNEDMSAVVQSNTGGWTKGCGASWGESSDNGKSRDWMEVFAVPRIRRMAVLGDSCTADAFTRAERRGEVRSGCALFERGAGGREFSIQPPGELAAVAGELFHVPLRAIGNVEVDRTGEVWALALNDCFSEDGPGRALVLMAAIRIASWFTTVDRVLLKPLPAAGDEAGMGRGVDAAGPGV